MHSKVIRRADPPTAAILAITAVLNAALDLVRAGEDTVEETASIKIIGVGSNVL